MQCSFICVHSLMARSKYILSIFPLFPLPPRALQVIHFELYILGAPAGRAVAMSLRQKRKHCERASRSRRRAPLAQCPGICDPRIVISLKILNKRLAFILRRLKALIVVQLRLWLWNNWTARRKSLCMTAKSTPGQPGCQAPSGSHEQNS